MSQAIYHLQNWNRKDLKEMGKSFQKTHWELVGGQIKFQILQEKKKGNSLWNMKMVSKCMIWVLGSSLFLMFMFMIFKFLIHILIYHILKPPSLPWKKPQTVHQSFLPILVIFHQFPTCLLKALSHSIQILIILILKVIYRIICRLCE